MRPKKHIDLQIMHFLSAWHTKSTDIGASYCAECEFLYTKIEGGLRSHPSTNISQFILQWDWGFGLHPNPRQSFLCLVSLIQIIIIRIQPGIFKSLSFLIFIHQVKVVWINSCNNQIIGASLFLSNPSIVN